MNGIICNDSIELVGHSLFLNFRYALKNYFKCNFKNVRDSWDLADIDTLIIVDEHFSPNVNIWKNENFINMVNLYNIKVLVFNFEKIFNSQFPWNVDHQRKLESFKNLIQLVSDVEDAKILGKKIINKQYLSKDTVLSVTPKDKKDKIIFIGQCNNYYPTRRQTLQQVQNLGLPIDINITDRKLSYNDFLQCLSEYKFVLNPLGTGQFLNLRFYESLKLGCTPIQEITPEMTNWYDELSSCITFNAVNQLSNQLPDTSGLQPFNYYLEDYFEKINLKSILELQ